MVYSIAKIWWQVTCKMGEVRDGNIDYHGYNVYSINLTKTKIDDVYMYSSKLGDVWLNSSKIGNLDLSDTKIDTIKIKNIRTNNKRLNYMVKKFSKTNNQKTLTNFIYWLMNNEDNVR